ncbi:MAG: aspartate aminotransferase family protein [Gammaproteobacteria bacterium]
MNKQSLLERRINVLGKNTPLFYDEPVHIVRGEGVWLYDADGKRYLDCYNNVPHVGHCHPYVVEALYKQASTLNVHTRYLHETIVEYAERLTAMFPDPLKSVMFVCTGSEANDQALRIARLHTGGEGIICTDMTYHGNTTAVDQISPLFYGGVPQHPNVRAIPFPDTYRPMDGLAGETLLNAYLAQVQHAIDDFAKHNIPFAGMLLCSIFANEGLPNPPTGFVKRAVEMVRAAGGLFIADEVQAGFGRTGKMWGFEFCDVTPDIVTLGKPIGNGHPLAAVVARGELVNQFREQVMYFNTFAGNPVSCAVGNAVLDVMAEENLQANAAQVGGYIRRGLRELQQSHPMIGDIRGHGLWIGIELVKDQHSKEPATEVAKVVINELKDRGVLTGRIGPYDNVIKIRPPLPIQPEHADLLLENLALVLGNMA